MRHLIAGFVLGWVCLAANPFAAIAQDNDSDAQAIAYPEPPEFIRGRIENGRFDLSDFEYLRGYFPEASAAQKAQYTQVSQWLDRCEEEGRQRLDTELVQLDGTLPAGHSFGTPNICGQVITGDSFEEFTSFEDLLEASRGARLVLDTLKQSIARAEQGIFSSADDLEDALHRRTLSDQLLRNAFYWGWADANQPGFPKMTQAEQTVFIALLNSETLLADHRNTNWLKGVVDENGWPRISKVGKAGARAAWLLTQHADMDPAFQLRALELMEPLLDEGEVSKGSYAYIYDRIMLKLSGKQRYGTQVECKDGERIPRPLEEPEKLDELRAEMGMGSFAEYREGFPAACPA